MDATKKTQTHTHTEPVEQWEIIVPIFYVLSCPFFAHPFFFSQLASMLSRVFAERGGGEGPSSFVWSKMRRSLLRLTRGMANGPHPYDASWPTPGLACSLRKVKVATYLPTAAQGGGFVFHKTFYTQKFEWRDFGTWEPDSDTKFVVSDQVGVEEKKPVT